MNAKRFVVDPQIADGDGELIIRRYDEEEGGGTFSTRRMR